MDQLFPFVCDLSLVLFGISYHDIHHSLYILDFAQDIY